MTTAETKTRAAAGGFISKFTVLRTAPRELWIVYLAKVLEMTAYGLVSLGLMLYLLDDLRLPDLTAGTMISVWSVLITFFTFLAGSLTDAVGIRRALLYGFSLCLVTRTVAAFSSHPMLVPIFSLMPMALGLALTVPVMTAAMRRYTNVRQRSIAFSLYYVLMNLGFIVAGWGFDGARTAMGKGGTLELPMLPVVFSVYQTVFLVAVGFTLVGLLVVLFGIRRGVEMSEQGETYTVDPAREAPEEGGVLGSFWRVLVKTGRIFKEVLGEGAFYRFLLLLTLLVGVRMVFYHMHYTLPPYLDRELGYGSRFGTAWGVLNPLIIVILVPLVGALAQNISSYRMIVVGTCLSALPTALLVLPQDTFAGLTTGPVGAALGWFLDIDGPIAPLYVNLLIFVVIFSVGEAIWSPRLYEYTASVAPKGREGTYMGLSLLPYFLAKFGVGPLSGYLLQHYCPAEGARDSSTIWWIVASLAIVSPVSVVLLKGVIRPRSRDDEGHPGAASAAASPGTPASTDCGKAPDAGQAPGTTAAAADADGAVADSAAEEATT